MDVYAGHCYKEVVRERLRACRTGAHAISLKQIASRIPIQYTYLSKALNDEKTHLNEDHLFAICHCLKLLPDETDFLLLLRARAIAASPARQQYLDDKIASLRRARHLNAAIQNLKWEDDSEYLLDGIAVVIHVCLTIPEYAANPRRLCAPLGIAPRKLQAVLDKLQRLGVIQLDGAGNVARIIKDHIHYSADHPLMRTHQTVLRTLCASHLQQAEEADKQSFMVTFTADEEARGAIKTAFECFIGEVEKIAIRSRQKHAYQLNFELFTWV